MKGDRFYQSQYILNRCFVNRKNILRTSLNTSQDYLNAVYDAKNDALRVDMGGGMLPAVTGVDNLPDSANDGQICPVIDTETDSIDFYQWDEAAGEWKYRGGTLQEDLDPRQQFALTWVANNLEEMKSLVNHDYTVKTVEIELDPNSLVVDVQGNQQNIDDDLDGDDDTTTPYRIDIMGYVVGLATYADGNASEPDRYYTQVLYDSAFDHLGISHVYMTQDEYEYYSNLPNGKNILVAHYMSNAMASPVRRIRYTLTAQHTAIDQADGYEYSVVETGDGSYALEVPGYVLGLQSYQSSQSQFTDRYYTKVLYEPDGVEAGRSTICFESAEYDGIAAMQDGRNVIDVFTVARVFPASVEIGHSELPIPSGRQDYVVIDEYGNVTVVPESSGQHTHVRIPVAGYVLDIEGYYSDVDTRLRRLVAKMSYDIDTDVTQIYLDRDYYETVAGLHDGRNAIGIYSVGSGMREGGTGGGGIWGTIAGDLENQTDLKAALDAKANLVDGKVPEGELPKAIPNGGYGVIKYSTDYGLRYLSGSGKTGVQTTTINGIDGKTDQYRPVTPSNLDYAVRSVLPNVTVIPSSTTSYNLLDSSATTNNHSHTYVHTPDAATSYVLPAVTSTGVSHAILLTVDFTNTQTYAFEDVSGNAVVPLFTPSIGVGDVYTFKCEYSVLQSKWLVFPVKEGAVSDDYILQSEKGAAGGVAELDANGKVPRAELPVAGMYGGSGVGVVTWLSTYGIDVNNGIMRTIKADSSQIDSRYYNYHPIVPSNLNYAVTAALTDANKIQMTDAQKESAQDTIGIWTGTLQEWTEGDKASSGDICVITDDLEPAGWTFEIDDALSDVSINPVENRVIKAAIDAVKPIVASSAPTTSTVGEVGQLYVDTTTNKTYHCTAVTNTGTEAEPVWSYAWVDDVNAKGGTILGNLGIRGGRLVINNSSYTSYYTGIVAGTGCTANSGAYAIGYNLNANNVREEHGRVVVGRYNDYNLPSYLTAAHFVVGVGTGENSRKTGFVVYPDSVYISDALQQGITVIPPTTTAYTLAEGVQSHIPSSASTYTLPAIPQRIIADGKYFTRNPSTDGTGYYGWLSGSTNRYTASATPSVGDNTYTNTALTSGAKAITAIDNRTHTVQLTVKFTSSDLSVAFEDADGNAITPLSTPAIAAGTVIQYLCEWDGIDGEWVVMPLVMKEGGE